MMSKLFTCIECGHHPISATASQCPKCSKNPHGHTCKFCNTKVADSKAIIKSETIVTWDDDYDDNGQPVTNYHERVEYYHFHRACLNKINTIQYKCPTCSALNTQFTRSCVNCGHPFETVRCNNCGQLVLKALAVKGDNILGRDNYFHPICADRIRPALEKKARIQQEINAKREAEQRIREAEQRRIKARQEEEDKLWQKEQKKKEEIDRRQRKIDNWWSDNAFSAITGTIFFAILSLLTLEHITWLSILFFCYCIFGTYTIIRGMNGEI